MRSRDLLFLVGLQIIAGPALAQPAPGSSAPAAASAAASAAARGGPSQEERDRARALMDEGDERTEKADYPAALAAYEKAHAIMRVPTTGIEVAKALEKVGKLGSALTTAREVAAMPVTAGEPKPFTDAREQAKKLAAAIEPRVPTLAINVTVAIAGARAEISLDGRKLRPEELAEPLLLDPGQYKVSATAEGHTPASVEVTLKERDRVQAALALAKIGTVAAPPTVKVVSPPVSLSRAVPIGFSIAGAGAIAGVITGVLALSAAKEVNTSLCSRGSCPNDAALKKAQERYQTADILAIVSDASFGLAVAGAALGVYGIAATLSRSSSPSPSAPPKAAIVVGPGSISVRGSF